jgi:palmitoyltransferase
MFKKISDRCSGRANNNTASLSELSSFKRTNGFTWPPDKAQVFTWIVLVYFGLAIFGSFCVSLAQPYSYVFGLLAAGFYLTHIALNIATMAINPGEEVTLNKKITPKNKFDRDKHKHVIENQFCNICQIVV